MKILYLSSIDLSLGVGPSVNEYTFVKHLSYLNKNSYFVFAKPNNDLNLGDDRLHKVYNSVSGYQKATFFFVIHELYKLFLGLFLIFYHRIDYLIIRLQPFSFSSLLFVLLFPNKVHVKTVGRGIVLFKIGFSLFDWVHSRILKTTLRRCRSIDCVSEVNKELIFKKFGVNPKKIHVIDNGVDLSLFRRRKKEFSFLKDIYKIDLEGYDYVLGYSGNLAFERGGLELVKTVKYLNDICDMRIAGIILGDISSREMIMNSLEYEELDNVFFTGKVPFQHVPYFLSCFDIGFSILPIKNQGASCQKVRQYSAMGVYCISTPGQEEYLEDYSAGTIVKNSELDTLPTVVKDILNKKTFDLVPSKELLDRIDSESAVIQRINILLS